MTCNELELCQRVERLEAAMVLGRKLAEAVRAQDELELGYGHWSEAKQKARDLANAILDTQQPTVESQQPSGTVAELRRRAENVEPYGASPVFSDDFNRWADELEALEQQRNGLLSTVHEERLIAAAKLAECEKRNAQQAKPEGAEVDGIIKDLRSMVGKDEFYWSQVCTLMIRAANALEASKTGGGNGSEASNNPG